MTIQPASKPTSPLRRRMLEDMTMRGLHEDAQRDYVRFLRSFAGAKRTLPIQHAHQGVLSSIVWQTSEA